MPKPSWGDVGEDPFGANLEEFEVYEGDLPPKGVYRFELTMLRLKENRNGDPMINGRLRMAELRKDKKQYNGYGCWFNLNVTKQGRGWVNNFIDALAKDDKQALALRKAFWDQKVMLDKEEPPNILSIGTLKIHDKNLVLRAQCGVKKYEGELDLDPKVFLRDDGKVPADADAETETEEEGWEETEKDASDSDEPADLDEEYDERAEELEDLSETDLKKILKSDHEKKLADYKGKTKDELVEMILDLEFPEDEESEEEVEEEPAEEEDLEEQMEAREEELSELGTAELKKILKTEHGKKLADYRGKGDEDLVAMILAAEFPDAAEEEPPAEPAEPPKTAGRRAGRRKPTAADESEPPF